MSKAFSKKVLKKIELKRKNSKNDHILEISKQNISFQRIYYYIDL